MKRLLLTFLLFSCIASYGQKSRYRPFKMIIIAPDTAIIHDNLKVYIDTVESNYISRYYNAIRRMEESLTFTDYPDEMKKEFEKHKKELEENLKAAKLMEPEIKKFKYFESIPDYTISVFQLYFNEYPPNSTFQVVRKNSLTTNDLGQIADQFKADYVVTYKDIHTDIKDNELIIKLTTTLYSKKESKTLFEKETTGDTNSYGDMWTCLDPLSCLLVTSVKSSSLEIFQTVSETQKK